MAEETENRFQFIDEDKELSREAYDDNERSTNGPNHRHVGGLRLQALL